MPGTQSMKRIDQKYPRATLCPSAVMPAPASGVESLQFGQAHTDAEQVITSASAMTGREKRRRRTEGNPVFMMRGF